MKKSILAIVLLLIASILGFAYRIHASGYYYLDLDLGISGYAKGINDLGQVTGFYSRNYMTYGFRWDPVNGLKDIGTVIPDYGYSMGWAINNLGQVAGLSSSYNNSTAILWDQNKGMKDLNTLGVYSSRAYGINDNGYVVGELATSYPSDVVPKAFLWTTSTGMVDMGTFGNKSATFTCVSDG